METKRLIETENSIQEFTVQFYGGTVMIEQNQLPLGQISCELLDHPVEELLALHDEAVRLFSIVRDSLFARCSICLDLRSAIFVTEQVLIT